ncbi:unnamed protein product [Closterium sp. NIES-64]|nr:unnamed protein product [Closterium sp. NIES-64]CAI5955489.1 unnamed protein product [Closterium sp. NIES-65]
MAGVAPPARSSAIPDLNEPFMEEDVDAARANIPADMVVDVDAARAKIPADPTIPLPPGTKGAPEPGPDRYSPRSDTEQPPPIGPFPENDYMYLTVEDLLAADEKDDAFLHNIPRDDFAEAAFDINKELAKKNRLLRMMWAFRHLDTLEARTTRVQYLRALLDFRRWCCANLPRQPTARVKGDGVLEHEDEIGRYIDEDMGDQWHTAKGDLQWMHGPCVNATRIRAYILSIAREYGIAKAEELEELNPDVRVQPLKPTSVSMLLIRIKALQTACKVEGTLFGVKELHIMYDISEVRSEVRAMVREKWHRDDRDCVDRHRGTLGDTYTTDQIHHLMFKVLPTWAARAYEPKAATPSQTLWKFLLMRTMTLLGHHTLLRGASLRAIELPDLFLYRMGSASPEHSTRRPVVMVVASRNSKTNKDARLHHSYAARHLEQEMCAVGHTLLWLHFVYDQLSRSPTSRCVPPLDFTTPYSWYHKHLFHARNDKEQKELPASSHSRITKEMWRTNNIFITRNTHAARAGGAQELADDGVPRSDIADLGHWALDKLAKSYITTIPKAAVLRKAGYTGKRGDYHLGRSMVKPDDKVVALIAQHIFPWAEAELAKVSISDGNNADNPPTISTTTLYRRLIVFVFVFDSQAVKCASAREPNTAGVHFLQSLIEFGRRIVAEDLTCMLMREPWHPYVQSSKLCRDPDFQKWAKDVNRVDLETIATRSTPSENPQEEFSARIDAEYQVDQLTMMLHRQREDAAIEKLEMQKKLEEKDAEIAKLMQALKLAEARPTPSAPAPSRPMTAAEKAASVKIEKEQEDDLTYEVNVVHPWRTSKTVEAAWRWWNNPSNFDSRPLRERFDEHRFLVRHTRMICKVEKGDKPAASAKSAKSSSPTTEVGETGKNDALQHCTRRMRRIMEAVHDLRRSDDAADTAAVIKLLDHLGRAGLSTFSDALLVLRATPPIKVPTTADGKSVGIKGLDKPLARKLAVAWGVVTAGYMDADWGKRLFGDLWDEQANKAGLEAEATVGAIGAGKRKRAG